MKKIYIHEGKGHFIGSCVVVISDNLETAKSLIRDTLNTMGLHDEPLSITERKIENNTVILYQDGDY